MTEKEEVIMGLQKAQIHLMAESFRYELDTENYERNKRAVERVERAIKYLESQP